MPSACVCVERVFVCTLFIAAHVRLAVLPRRRSAGGGADLLGHVGVGLGYQETQATSSQTNQIHRALVVCSYQTGPIHSQDAVSDPQSAVGGGGSVRDQSPDVNAWSVERSVLQEGHV